MAPVDVGAVRSGNCPAGANGARPRSGRPIGMRAVAARIVHGLKEAGGFDLYDAIAGTPPPPVQRARELAV
jgi:hypothetical protein